MSEQTQTPRVLWAQQQEHVLLTVAVPDIEKVDVKFQEDSVSFQGRSSSSNAKVTNLYAFKVDLYEKIDPQTSKYENIGQKFWRLLLKKQDPKAAFWPRLTKEKTRLHWLQTDFDHWKEQDESDDEKPGFSGNFADMFSGGMGGMGGMPDADMGDVSSDEEDNEGSDDEKTLPEGNENSTNGKESESSNDQPSTTTTTESETASKQPSA